MVVGQVMDWIFCGGRKAVNFCHPDKEANKVVNKVIKDVMEEGIGESD